jgi:hypothetical protein
MELNKKYYEDGVQTLKSQLEENEEMFDNWTLVSADYALISTLMEFEDIVDPTDYNNAKKIVGRYHCTIGSNSIKSLKRLWQSDFFKHSYDTTVQHFIVDMKNKKVVEFLSVCM